MSDVSVWMYVSRSCLPQATAGPVVADIVERARLHNAAHGLTGMLLFTGARFAQYLEGPGPAIAHISASIAADQRHDDLVVTMSALRTARSFSDWSLGYNGPSRYVTLVVERVATTDGRRNLADVEGLVRLMMEFAA